MKRFVQFTLCMAMTALSVSAAHLDLRLTRLVNEWSADSLMRARSARADEPVSKSVGVLISLGKECSTTDLENAGARIIGRRADVALAVVPVNRLKALGAVAGVRSIAASTECSPQLYFAREYSNANAAIDGTDPLLTRPYTGKGVVVGFSDQGMDPNHVNFMNADLTESRVKEVYVFRGDDGSYSAYTTPEEIAAFTTDSIIWTHATHVAGIMAGGYRGDADFGFEHEVVKDKAMPFYGVASDADIVMTGGMLYDINILAGVDKVIEYAQAHDKPCVVNLSLGNVVGPHDGSSAFCRYLADAGQDAVICLASGNDGMTNCTFTRTFTDSSRRLTTRILDENGSGSPAYAQFWSDSDKPLSLEFIIYNVQINDVIASFPLNVTDEIQYLDANNIVFGDQFASAFTQGSQVVLLASVDPNNNRYSIECLSKLSLINDHVIGAVRIRGEAGTRVDGYVQGGRFTASGMKSWVVGTPDDCVSDLATGENVICVGAYMSATYSTMLNAGETESWAGTPVETVCDWSSYGPTFSGRMLPDFCGPGAILVSSGSLYYYGQSPSLAKISASAYQCGRNNYWVPMQGTSMSCPFVAGTAALMLEANPELDVAGIKSLLRQTCDSPGYDLTQKAEMQWGAGRVNTTAAVQAAADSTSSLGKVDADSRLFVKKTADGILRIHAVGAQNVRCTAYSIDGRRVSYETSAGSDIDFHMAQCASGLYIVEVESEDASGRHRHLSTFKINI